MSTTSDYHTRQATPDGLPANQPCPYCKKGWVNAEGFCEYKAEPYAGSSFFVGFDRSSMSNLEVADLLVSLAARVEVEGVPMVEDCGPCVGLNHVTWDLGGGVEGCAYTADGGHEQF